MKRPLRRRCHRCGIVYDAISFKNFLFVSGEALNHRVWWDSDPFLEEIEGIDTKYWMCGVCRKDSEDEI